MKYENNVGEEVLNSIRLFEQLENVLLFSWKFVLSTEMIIKEFAKILFCTNFIQIVF